jgi:transposase InsO family protein
VARQATAVAPNVLDRGFGEQAPNRKWIVDFTYVWTAKDGFKWQPPSICSRAAWSVVDKRRHDSTAHHRCSGDGDLAARQT